MIQYSPEELLRLATKEIIRNKFVVAITFAVISISILVMGLFWPLRFSAFSTIYADEKNIIQPLTQNVAATTDVATDRIRLAKELIFSQKILTAVLTEAKLIDDTTPPFEREKIFEQVQRHTDVSNVGKNLLKIEFSGSDPQQAYVIAKRFTELFMEESQDVQKLESVDAYNFLDTQLKEYHKKLIEAEQKLMETRTKNVNAGPANETEVGGRISTLKQRIEQSQIELREALIKKQTLESQLSGEAEINIAASKEGQYRTRIAELQTELEGLRLKFHDTHPDIIRIKHQIEDLRDAIEAEKKRREDLKNNKLAGGKPVLDDAVTLSPLYQQLKTELSQTKTLIATLETRINENQRLLDNEISRAKQIHTVEANLAELTRDYNVNKEFYDQLQKKREAARISMSLGMGSQGMKIQEPARLPIRPSGLRFVHFMFGGIIIGLIIPLLYIYAIIMLDPRIRSRAVLNQKFQLPILASIPELTSSDEKQKIKSDMRVIAGILGAVMVVYLIIAILKFMRVV